MTHGNRPTINVDDVFIDFHFIDKAHDDRSKSFIDFKQINIGNFHTCDF